LVLPPEDSNLAFLIQSQVSCRWTREQRVADHPRPCLSARTRTWASALPKRVLCLPSSTQPCCQGGIRTPTERRNRAPTYRLIDLAVVLRANHPFEPRGLGSRWSARTRTPALWRAAGATDIRRPPFGVGAEALGIRWCGREHHGRTVRTCLLRCHPLFHSFIPWTSPAGLHPPRRPIEGRRCTGRYCRPVTRWNALKTGRPEDLT
jgi:hypothetical protein